MGDIFTFIFQREGEIKRNYGDGTWVPSIFITLFQNISGRGRYFGGVEKWVW